MIVYCTLAEKEINTLSKIQHALSGYKARQGKEYSNFHHLANSYHRGMHNFLDKLAQKGLYIQLRALHSPSVRITYLS